MDPQESTVYVTWQTSAYDGYRHAITDEEFTFGPGRQAGHFEAVCGHNMCMGDSFEAPGQRCQQCVRFIRAKASMRPMKQRLGREHRGVRQHIYSLLFPRRARHAR